MIYHRISMGFFGYNRRFNSGYAKQINKNYKSACAWMKYILMKSV